MFHTTFLGPRMFHAHSKSPSCLMIPTVQELAVTQKRASAKMDMESNCVNMISRLYTCASTHHPQRTKQLLIYTCMQSCDKFAKGIFEKQHERLNWYHHRLWSDISSLVWFHWERQTLGTPLRWHETVRMFVTRAYDMSFVHEAAFLAVTRPMACLGRWQYIETF